MPSYELFTFVRWNKIEMLIAIYNKYWRAEKLSNQNTSSWMNKIFNNS
jgi:hypothetical protein